MTNIAHIEKEEPHQAGAVLEPETITPSQFFSPAGLSADLQPEKRLLLSVLEGAVADYQRFAHAREAGSKRQFTEAAAWFASTDRTWPFAFENACDWLGLDADTLRQGLRAWHAAQVAGDHRAIKISPFRRVVGTRHKATGRAPGLSHLRVAS